MESMPLAVGQALLDFVVASGAELRSVSDVDLHSTGSTSDEREAGLGVQTVDADLVFEYLLGEELAFERDLSERCNLVDVPLRNGLVFATDEHGHVSCHVGAIVDKEYGRGFSIVFDPPLVDRLVGGDGQRPLADRVRVCSYLVRLSCKAVGLLGGTLRFDGDPVGFLSRAVRLLRELVAMARLEQGDTSGDTANQSRDGANDAGDRIDVHSTDSTAGGER